jgi:hypothetical protein
VTNQISIAGGAEFDIASLTRVQNPAVLLLRGEPTTALIMGGTNNPDPNAAYIADVTQRYVDPLADLPYDPPPVGVHTPEQFFPVFGSQTFDDSVAEGVPDLQESVSRARVDFGGDPR